jgi:hypothetical protein
VPQEQPAPTELVLTSDDVADRITQAELEELGKKYNRGWRQLRRWISIGRESGDQCPVRDPQRLLQWWRRRMTHAPPAHIVRLAISASSPSRPSSTEEAVPFQVETPIDLKAIDSAEGEHVRQVRRLAQGIYNQLEIAYMRGSPEIDSLSRRYEKAVEMLRKLEITDREAQRQRGSLLPIAQVERDAAMAADMLQAMRLSMVRRVLEQCSFLKPEAKNKVAAAIEKARKAEDRIFRNLQNLSTPEFEAMMGGELPQLVEV